MKTFLLKTVCMSLPVILILYIKPVYLLATEKYKTQVAGGYIYHAIEKSKESNASSKLILGDSVGRQLFPNDSEYEDINSLCTNQAVSMCGQYLLLKNYLNAGNKIDTLYLLFNPLSLLNNLNQVYTFHYFLKPFNRPEYRNEFSGLVADQISRIPYHFLAHEPYILTSNWAPDYQPEATVQPAFKRGATCLSPISVEYLKKIKKLGQKHGFNIAIIPTPTSIKHKKFIDNLDRNQISSNGFNDIFAQYFDNIIYLDDSLFSDGIHLINPQDYESHYVDEWIR